ncbi:hypothetical protein [Flavobacterium yafengii]|nr:hypothetical protein [Flavobacterium yafengii]MDI5899042.1 hypothetical protein [Flavobacterium yafengii]
MPATLKEVPNANAKLQPTETPIAPAGDASKANTKTPPTSP